MQKSGITAAHQSSLTYHDHAEHPRAPLSLPDLYVFVHISLTMTLQSNLNIKGLPMRYNKLGDSGLLVSELSFGCEPPPTVEAMRATCALAEQPATEV